MKKLNYVYLTVLAVIGFAIPCSGQITYRSIPDTMVVITPEQDLFYMGLAFTVKELRTTIALKDKQLKNVNSALQESQLATQEAHNQEKLQKDNYDNCKKDLAVEQDKLKNVERKSILQKIVLWVSVPLAIVETAYIGLSQVIKKAP